MRLGVFGGTFDPVHYGHLLLAEQCREQCGLDSVRFIPAGAPPHKLDQPLTPGPLRAEMLEYALAGQPAFSVDRRELNREGPSFTVDTLRELQAELPAAELVLILGADSLFDLPHWRAPRDIAELARLAVVNRGREPLPSFEPLAETLGPAAAEILVVTMPAVDLASRDLRQRVREGRSVRFMTPRAVEEFIRAQKLYAST